MLSSQAFKPVLILISSLIGVALIWFSCGKKKKSESPEPDNDEVVEGPSPDTEAPTVVVGHAFYSVGDELFRIEAKAGAKPTNLSTEFDKIQAGTRDRYASPSPNGSWIVLAADRGCDGECIVRVSGDLKTMSEVKPGGAQVFPAGLLAITNDGNTVVFPSQDGPHEIDLYKTDLAGTAWSTPVLLTVDSTYSYNNMPALNFDGTLLSFDCGQNPFPEEGRNDACEVKLDGSGFAKVVGPDALASPRYDYVQNPHRGLDGLLFEATWPLEGDSPEMVWLKPASGGDPQPLGKAFPSSVSPCPLADGRFFLLWLGGPNNAPGNHELTLVARDGSLIAVLTPGVDVTDAGIGCSD